MNCACGQPIEAAYQPGNRCEDCFALDQDRFTGRSQRVKIHTSTTGHEGKDSKVPRIRIRKRIKRKRKRPQTTQSTPGRNLYNTVLGKDEYM